MSPDLRRKVDQNRAARLAMENETRKQMEAQVRFTQDTHALSKLTDPIRVQLKDPDSQKPVWADSR